MTTSRSLRIALAALAASTSLTGLAAQTAPAGRPAPIRIGTPKPAATPTPTPTPTATPAGRPAPIRLGAPKPAATPTPAPTPTATPTPAPAGRPAPIRLGAPKPAATPTPAPAPAATPAPAPGGRPAPIPAGTPKPAATPTPAPAPAATPAPAPGGRPAPIPAGTPKPAPAPAAAPATAPSAKAGPPVIAPVGKPPVLNVPTRALLESDPLRGGPDEIVPPPSFAAPRVPDQIDMATGVYRPKKAVIRQGSFTEQLKSLGPTVPISLAQLQSNPRFQLGTTQVDMSRVLANPKSVANTAVALQQLDGLVTVNSTAFSVTKANSGLVVRSFVNYSLLPGSCTKPERRKKVEAAGVRCATAMTPAQRDSAFATVGNPRYVADPKQRAEAIALAKTRAAEDSAMLADQVTALRADFKDPARRAEMVAALGKEEVARLEGLNDTGLAEEIVNSGFTKLEDVSYIPINDAAQTFKPATKLGLEPPPLPADVAEEFDLGTTYYLAGFTLGREYEWKLRVEQRINLCLIGCAKTYFVEAFAGFNYGLGLRFPIELTGVANYNKGGTDGIASATVTPTFKTIDGGPEQYLAAGLPSEKLFEGKEFVAQFGAHAGFGYSLPFTPALSIAYSRELDFTDYLPSEFGGGNFAPPNPPKPGQAGETLKGPLVLKDIDLIGGQANFGIVGAQVNPAANIILTSNQLSFTLVDRNGGPPIPVTTSGVPITLKPDSKTGSLEFDIKDPVYNLELTVEPGINAHLFVDIGVWGRSWDLPVFFPSLAIKLPSGGVNFACHDGTVCSREFNFAPDPQEGAMQDLARWVNGYETRGFALCPDSICEKEVRTMRSVTELAAKLKIKELGQSAPVNLAQDPYFAKLFNEAEAAATKSHRIAMLRRFGIEFEPTWASKCPDDACRSTITSLRVTAENDFKNMLAKGPTPPPPGGISLYISELSGTLLGAGTKAQKVVLGAINAKIAASPAKWIGTVKAEYDKQCLDEQCLLDVAVTADVMGGNAASLYKLSPELKIDNVVTQVTKAFRPRFAKAVADSKKRAAAKAIK